MTLYLQRDTFMLKRYIELTIPANAARRSENLVRKNILKELESHNFNSASPRSQNYQSTFTLSKGAAISLTEKKMLKQMGSRGGILH